MCLETQTWATVGGEAEWPTPSSVFRCPSAERGLCREGRAGGRGERPHLLSAPPRDWDLAAIR